MFVALSAVLLNSAGFSSLSTLSDVFSFYAPQGYSEDYEKDKCCPVCTLDSCIVQVENEVTYYHVSLFEILLVIFFALKQLQNK